MRIRLLGFQVQCLPAGHLPTVFSLLENTKIAPKYWLQSQPLETCSQGLHLIYLEHVKDFLSNVKCRDYHDFIMGKKRPTSACSFCLQWPTVNDRTRLALSIPKSISNLGITSELSRVVQLSVAHLPKKYVNIVLSQGHSRGMADSKISSTLITDQIHI